MNPNDTGALNQGLHTLTVDFIGWIELVLTTGTRNAPGPIGTYLYGTGLGLGELITVIISAVVIPFGLVLFKGKRALEAATNSIVVLVLGPWVFWLLDVLDGFSDSLVQLARFYIPPDGHIVAAPGTLNTIANIAALIAICVGGVFFAAVLISNMLGSQLARFFVMPTYALRPIGNMPKNWSDWVISILIVTIITARPMGTLVITACKWVSDEALKTSGILSAWILGISFFLATILVVGMFYVTKKVVTKASDAIKSRVRGLVETKPKDRRPIPVSSINASIGRTMQPLPVRIVGAPPTPTSKLLIDKAKGAAGKALMTKAVASTNPVVAGGLTIVKGVKTVKKVLTP